MALNKRANWQNDGQKYELLCVFMSKLRLLVFCRVFFTLHQQNHLFSILHKDMLHIVGDLVVLWRAALVDGVWHRMALGRSMLLLLLLLLRVLLRMVGWHLTNGPDHTLLHVRLAGGGGAPVFP